MNLIELMSQVLGNLEAGRVFNNRLLFKGAPSPATSLFEIAWNNPELYTLAPRTRIVNGFEVPVAESEAPKHDTLYFIEDLLDKDYYDTYTWVGDSSDIRALARDILHLSPENAIANTKAKLGIDPSGK